MTIFDTLMLLSLIGLPFVVMPIARQTAVLLRNRNSFEATETWVDVSSRVLTRPAATLFAYCGVLMLAVAVLEKHPSSINWITAYVWLTIVIVLSIAIRLLDKRAVRLLDKKNDTQEEELKQ